MHGRMRCSGGCTGRRRTRTSWLRVQRTRAGRTRRSFSECAPSCATGRSGWRTRRRCRKRRALRRSSSGASTRGRQSARVKSTRRWQSSSASRCSAHLTSSRRPSRPSGARTRARARRRRPSPPRAGSRLVRSKRRASSSWLCCARSASSCSFDSPLAVGRRRNWAMRGAGGTSCGALAGWPRAVWSARRRSGSSSGRSRSSNSVRRLAPVGRRFGSLV